MQVSLALSFGLRVGWRAARACRVVGERSELASHILVKRVLVQPDGWARGEREGYGEPRDVTSLSLKRVQAGERTQLSVGVAEAVTSASKEGGTLL